MKAQTAAQRRMLAAIDKHAKADGWASWTDVYNEWDPIYLPVQFVGRAAQLCWKGLELRDLAEAEGDRVRRKETK